MRSTKLEWVWPAFVLIAMASGCTHTQLRRGTVKQAKTLTSIYEQQVLDNLAMFATNPNSLPFFAAPKDGIANVVDGGRMTILGDPNNSFFNAFTFDGNRSIQESWGLTPVSDPRKLQRMRCAYQRAVGGRGEDCIDCCDLEKGFLGKQDAPKLVINHKGEPVKKDDPECLDAGVSPFLEDPITDEPYLIPVTWPDAGFCDIVVNDGGLIYKLRKYDRNDKPYKYRKYGKAVAVVQEKYDCDGPCAVKSCWFCVGSKKEIPKHCGRHVGHYCGTYVWVTPNNLDHLTRLVLKILDYAVNDPPATATKTVTAYLADDGQPATKDSANWVVEASIPIGNDLTAIRTFDEQARAAANARKKKRAIGAELGELDTSMKNLREKLGGSPENAKSAQMREQFSQQMERKTQLEAELRDLKSQRSFEQIDNRILQQNYELQSIPRPTPQPSGSIFDTQRQLDRVQGGMNLLPRP